jgi:hypothetical protein
MLLTDPARSGCRRVNPKLASDLSALCGYRLDQLALNVAGGVKVMPRMFAL